MYKRKFPKTKTVVENVLSQSLQTSTNSSLRHSTPSIPTTSKNNNSDIESSESPSMLDDFNDFPIEKKRKIDDDMGDTTDCSQPLFDIDDDNYSYLKQTLISCGLHLKSDQNILCEFIICIHIC